MRGTAAPTTIRGSGELAGPPPSVQFLAVEEKLSAGLEEESKRKSERRGWAVREIMARATKRRGISRSFSRHAGEASLCAP
jgi:hypothetical protein